MNKMFRRLLSLMLVVVMVLSLGIFTSANESYDKVITIVHTNDVHARIDVEPVVATLVQEKRANGENVLLLSAGDVLHGQTIATLSRGESIVRIMNATGYDALVPGNHEFNYGTDRLLELADLMEFPLIAANVQTKSGEDVFETHFIKEIDGVKVGIFGIATPETAYKTNPLNVQEIDFTDVYVAAERSVKALKEEGAVIIIALAHLGVDEGSIDRGDFLAEKVEGIDLVVDGHSHTVIPEGKLIGDTLLVQTGEYGNNIGIVDLYLKGDVVVNKEAKLLKVDENIGYEKDEAVATLISEIKTENEKVTLQVVSETTVTLDGERANVRTKETNLSNLIADAMIAETGADIAITNGGGIRASIQAGDITKGDIISVLPFGNFIVVKELKGADILLALEHGVDTYPDAAGHFPQVAGIRFEFDAAKPAGERVTKVTLANGAALDLEKVYTLATNDFMAAGGDNYSMLADGNILGQYASLDDAVISYLESGKEIAKEADGRTAVITVTQNQSEDSTVNEQPEESVVNEPQVQPETYVVKKGDNLWRIAKKFNTTYQKIAELNKIKNPNLIYPEQIVILP